MITIKELQPDMLIGLKELYDDGFEGAITSLEKITETYNLIKNDARHNIICAFKDNDMIGSVMGVVCHELFGECQPFMVIENVVVAKNYRKLGVAKMLFARLEDIARNTKCSMILFVSSKHRAPAHKLYESLGYAEDAVNGYRKRL